MDGHEDFSNFDFDPRAQAQYQQQQHHHSYNQRLSWPLHHHNDTAAASNASPMDSTSPTSSVVIKRSDSPVPSPQPSHAFGGQNTAFASASMMQDWQHMASQAPSHQTQQAFALNSAFAQPDFGTFDLCGGLQTSSPEFSHQQSVTMASSIENHPAVTMASIDNPQSITIATSLGGSPPMTMPPSMTGSPQMNVAATMENTVPVTMPTSMENNLTQGFSLETQLLPYTTQDVNQMIGWTSQVGYSNAVPTAPEQEMANFLQMQNSLNNSPTNIDFDFLNLHSPSSDGSWVNVHRNSITGSAVFNPGQALHLTPTYSDGSQSDNEQQPRSSIDSFCGEPFFPISSPGSTDGSNEIDGRSEHSGFFHETDRRSPSDIVTTTAITKPIPISPTSPTRKRKSSAGTKNSRRISQSASSGTTNKSDEGKKIGKRKGPLRPEQRKQASEIRKLGACIRCRFLKKTCDKGDPCGGCKPSHARLWLVPCTRIDIKDLGYFVKDWKADYERHVTLQFSINNIKGFGENETTLFITHGYGQYLPIKAREVLVRDDRVFGLNWVEGQKKPPTEHEVDTAKLSAGKDGVATSMLSDYLDRHIDGDFEAFVDVHFEGTPVVTEILKTAYRYWQKEQTPAIRKALKLVLAYNLTQAICLVEVVPGQHMDGLIDDDDSFFKGKVAAPVMINFEVKCGLADLWRELQREILEELSSLYSSFYSRDKLKHWPTIFMLAAILLIIWEEMQFDCHYRIPDASVVDKFCNDMEATPVGVIVGLFSAISQKVPVFTEWDTSKHHALLGSNEAVCTAMEEVKSHILNNEEYLRSRSQAKFDRDDFDCLSNKFVSKLMMGAH